MLIFSEKFKPIVLAIGAHPDDIELGAGGLIYRLAKRCKATIHFCIMTYGTKRKSQEKSYRQDERGKEAIEAAKILLNRNHNNISEYLHFAGFEDCKLHLIHHELIRYLEKLIALIKPDIILTHAPGDDHDDHCKVHEITRSATRSFHGFLLEYYSPSTRPDIYKPNYYIKLRDKEIKQKNMALQAHISQRDKDFMSLGIVQRLEESWAAFHKMKVHERLEAFVLVKGFWE